MVERRVSRGGIVREMDVDVFVSLDAAERICGWLQNTIEEEKSRSINDREQEES